MEITAAAECKQLRTHDHRPSRRSRTCYRQQCLPRVKKMPSSFASASVLLPVRDTSARPSRVTNKVVVIASLIWIVLVSGTAYVMEQSRRSHAESGGTASVLPPSGSSPSRRTPVHFTNPFDATEVFEFPPGTSEAQAHFAVAEVLLQRARERLDHTQHLTRVAAAGPVISAE